MFGIPDAPRLDLGYPRLVPLAEKRIASAMEGRWSHVMILVTGSSGLLGRELIRQLKGDHLPLRGLDLLPHDDPDELQPLQGDLLNYQTCLRACEGVTTIIHTAARQHHSKMPRWGREQFFGANIEMTQNLARAAGVQGVRHLIFVSSDMVYGLPPNRPLTEDDPPQPVGPYGRAKQASERACAISRHHNLCVTIFRPRLIIGPGRLGILQRLFDRIRLGQTVPILGSGQHRYQMVSVADVADACVLAAKSPVDGVFNLGSSEPPTVRELLTGLCRRAGTGSRVVSLPARAARAALWSLHAARLSPLAPEQFLIASQDYVLDSRKARETFGWQPRLSDSEMIWSAYQTYVQSLTPQAMLTAPASVHPHAA